jgi:DNA-binding transcriptional regulator YdaS (Cro superfamily)
VATTLSAIIALRFGGSQQAFAKKAGIDPGQLSRYLKLERGELGGSKPSADNVARIESATDGAIAAAHWGRLGRKPVRFRRAPQPA